MIVTLHIFMSKVLLKQRIIT